MNDPLRLPCPTCSGTRSTTTGDRHADTNMDVCATCHDEGTIPARPGETPEASFGFVNRNTTATAGKDFPKMGMSFPKSGNEARTISAAASGAERVDEARVEAAMDAFYPGEDGRVTLEGSWSDMRAAIVAADADAAASAVRASDGWQPIETAPSEPDCYHDLPGASDSGLGFATNSDTGEIEYFLWWERTGHSSSIVTHWHPKLAGPTGRADLADRGGPDRA